MDKHIYYFVYTVINLSVSLNRFCVCLIWIVSDLSLCLSHKLENLQTHAIPSQLYLQLERKGWFIFV